jgi:ubiquinol-cytochrome c reductase iron-sulfur subunit
MELPEWLVVVGVCTHLGCTPTASTPLAPQGDYGGWLCHCHGSQYDVAGRVRRGPAPQNLAVPPYAFLSSTRIKVG